MSKPKDKGTAKATSKGKGKGKGNGKGKGKGKEKGKKKEKEYQLSPHQAKQLKEVLLEYKQADDVKDTQTVQAIVKEMGDKLVAEAEVENEAEMERIHKVSQFLEAATMATLMYESKHTTVG